MWFGIDEATDQLNAMKYFRRQVNGSLSRIGYQLQDQGYDHVLSDDERLEDAFTETCDYIARNPERKNLVSADGYKAYPYTNALIPGAPEANVFDEDYW